MNLRRFSERVSHRRLSEIINTVKYPLNKRESDVYKRLVSNCHSKIKSKGYCELPKFLRPQMTQYLLNEAIQLEIDGYKSVQYHNIFLENTSIW